MSGERSAAPPEDVQFAETRSLMQCVTVDEWVSGALEVADPADEGDLRAYLEALCSRPENSGTPVCQDREHGSPA